MEGVELCSRFSYITNSLCFCGPKDAHLEFLKYLNSKEDKSKVEELLKKFEGILPYVSVIAERNGKEIFDKEAILRRTDEKNQLMQQVQAMGEQIKNLEGDLHFQDEDEQLLTAFALHH